MFDFFTARFAFAESGWVRPVILGALLWVLWFGIVRAGIPTREQ